VDVWKTCSDAVKVSRKNPVFLEKLKYFQDDYNTHINATAYSTKRSTLYHHVMGFASSGKGTKGGHLLQEAKVLLSDASGNQYSFIKITDMNDNTIPFNQLPKNKNTGVVKLDPNKYKMYITQYQDPNRLNYAHKQYRQKNILPDGNTFFPETMNYAQAIEQLASAIINPQKTQIVLRDIAFEAKSENGMIIRWYEDVNGKVTSFFPK